MRFEAELPSFVINFFAMKIDQFTIRIKNTRTMRNCLVLLLFFLGGISLTTAHVIPGAANFKDYVPSLKGKRVAIVGNHTSVVGNTHLVDTLISQGITIVKIFAPEHGFRGDAANGETIKNGRDAKTQLPIYSLYGSEKKPSSKLLKDVDVMIFDMQDVGVRYYTYLTTLHYVMEACAENHVSLWVLDRPNPNGHFVDGPVLNPKFVQSMVGLHPIPLVHGMTLGELAVMIKGEKWVRKAESLSLHVVPVRHYDHNTEYVLPIAPSPNLPTQASVILYPSLGLFEGTIMSMGRGTSWPFELIGAPWFDKGKFEFTPVDIPGKALNPPYKNQKCKGILLSDFAIDYLKDYQKIYLAFLIESYQYYKGETPFFNNFFDKLAGTPSLREAIIAGKTEAEIRESWKSDIELFKAKRKSYLLYPIDEDRGILHPTQTLKKP